MVSFKIPNALMRVPLMIIFLGSFNVAPRCVQNQNQNLVLATRSTNSSTVWLVPSNYAGPYVWTVRGSSRWDQIKINQSEISITSSHHSLRTLFWNNLHEYNLLSMALFLGVRPQKPGKRVQGTTLTWALKIVIEFSPLFVFVLTTSDPWQSVIFRLYPNWIRNNSSS